MKKTATWRSQRNGEESVMEKRASWRRKRRVDESDMEKTASLRRGTPHVVFRRILKLTDY